MAKNLPEHKPWRGKELHETGDGDANGTINLPTHLGDDAWFWVGHQGYEYVDLGRLWQLLLLGGLFLWLFLMGRAL